MGAASSMAQVYSQNAVGYYTLNLVQGFNLVANQLNNGDNNINTVIPPSAPLPDGTALVTWNTGTQSFNDVDSFFATFGWFDSGLNPSTTVLSPGGGAFIQLLPPATTASVVLVGDVPQGDLQLDLVTGFQIISQLTPQSIGVEVAGLPATDTDTIQFWNAGTQRYEDPINFFAGFGWFDSGLNQVDPTPLIGEAVFYNRIGAADTWTRTFSVN
jgi:hypothetical protein